MQQFMLRASVALGLALSIALAACSSSSSPTMDAGGSDGPAAGTFGAACVTVTDTSTECMGKACTNAFDMTGHPVCSQTCTMLKANDPTCPNGSMGQFCNMKGYCKP
jgi:hypothetical protein